jgi:hypothetical protein
MQAHAHTHAHKSAHDTVARRRWFGDNMVFQINAEYGARSFINGRARPVGATHDTTHAHAHATPNAPCMIQTQHMHCLASHGQCSGQASARARPHALLHAHSNNRLLIASRVCFESDLPGCTLDTLNGDTITSAPLASAHSPDVHHTSPSSGSMLVIRSSLCCECRTK